MDSSLGADGPDWSDPDNVLAVQKALARHQQLMQTASSALKPVKSSAQAIARGLK